MKRFRFPNKVVKVNIPFLPSPFENNSLFTELQKIYKKFGDNKTVKDIRLEYTLHLNGDSEGLVVYEK